MVRCEMEDVNKSQSFYTLPKKYPKKPLSDVRREIFPSISSQSVK